MSPVLLTRFYGSPNQPRLLHSVIQQAFIEFWNTTVSKVGDISSLGGASCQHGTQAISKHLATDDDECYEENHTG